MLGILANDPAHALTGAIPSYDETAVFADRFAGWSNFHGAGGAEGEGESGDGADVGGDGGLPAVDTGGAEVGELGEKRYTILPLPRSYGVISSFTRSPGRMRTR